MKTYKHLTPYERDNLVIGINKGQTLNSIAVKLGRHRSTLKRELDRNFGPRRYRPHKAHNRALKRHHEAHKKERLKSNALRHDVEALLMKGWSPEIISGRLNKKGKHPPISHEAIYQWIYQEATHLIEYLVRHHKERFPKHHSRKHQKTRIPQRIPIDERPKYVEDRKQPGHWETDQIVGKGSEALQVIVERKARFTCLQKTPDKTAASSLNALTNMFSRVPENLLKTITYDNGVENVKHQELNDKLGTRSFFCTPYHSWEKGSVENRNGVIRRFIPKGTDLSTMSDSQIRAIENWLNDRPMKCLDFETPAEVLNSMRVALTG